MPGKVNVDESEEKKPPETPVNKPLRTPDGRLISLNDEKTAASIRKAMENSNRKGGAELHPDDC